MKKLLAVALGCMFFSGATASSWIEVNEDEEGITSVNVEDLKKERIKNIQSVGAWVKSIYKVPQTNKELGNGEPITEFRTMRWYQCQGRRISDPVEITFYGINGEVIDSYSEETSRPSFKHVTPDTIESNIHTVVCMMDLTNQIEKLKERGPVSEYDYRRLKNEYPYQFKLIQEYKNSN